MPKTYCYYHNDADGKCAAAIIKQEFPGIYFISVSKDYDNLPNFNNVSFGDKVILLDLSLPVNVFESLQDKTEEILYIDHHITTLDRFSKIAKHDGFEHSFKLNEGAACLLTWKYFRGDQKVPYVVQLISDYDEWKFKYGDKTMLFHVGTLGMDMNPDSSIWDLFLDTSPKSKRDARATIESITSLGHTLLKYQESQVYDLVVNQSFFVNFSGLKFLAINAETSNIALRKADLKKFKIDVDALMLFYFRKNKWIINMYTEKDNIDLSIIAKKNGGGGHKVASGFNIKELPFKLNKETTENEEHKVRTYNPSE